MSKDTNTVRCTCTPSRGLACRRCYAPYYDAHPALIDPATVASQLVAMCESELASEVGDDDA